MDVLMVYHSEASRQKQTTLAGGKIKLTRRPNASAGFVGFPCPPTLLGATGIGTPFFMAHTTMKGPQAALTADYLRQFFDYDPCLGVISHKSRPDELFKSQADRARFKRLYEGKAAGCIFRDGPLLYIRLSLFGRDLMAHRVAWVLAHGEIPDGLVVDHVNGDGTDNRIENLRVVTVSENCVNAARSKRNKTGITGVCFNKATGRYVVSICRQSRPMLLSQSLQDFFEACCMRKSAEIRFDYHPNHGRARVASLEAAQ